MVVFDAGILISLLTPRTTEGHKKERLDFLVRTLRQTRTKILIPTPALSELLVHAPDLADEFSRSSGFEVVPFDQRAAIECALSIRAALSTGNKKGKQNAVWSKVKFDHQIVAIARSRLASCIYSDDKGLLSFARSIGMNAMSSDELPDDPDKAQGQLDLDNGS
ncbi:hypothetical protein [Paraburkholderia caledonica]|uniref:PIN domain-containing protein n=1 Tax=Paraburkholderia caledonica TaxID=134536 RepID=A0AB73IKH5_9BURK|nr:hypothetical protein [Paraburkholderia caledonica]